MLLPLLLWLCRSRQVYSKDELSPLPFQPPAAYTYFVTMLSGTFKVMNLNMTMIPLITNV
jgi:hypothetical protein